MVALGQRLAGFPRCFLPSVPIYLPSPFTNPIVVLMSPIGRNGHIQKTNVSDQSSEILYGSTVQTALLLSMHLSVRAITWADSKEAACELLLLRLSTNC